MGMSIIVGKIIFSIAGDLSYVDGRSHEFVLRLQVLLGLSLLHRLRKLTKVGVLG